MPRAGSASGLRRTRIGILHSAIPITSISTPAESTRLEYAATRPQQWPPNTVGRYRNCDPSLISYLIRLAVEKKGDEIVVPTARTVRQDWHPHHGAGNRPVRKLPHTGLRTRIGARLGQPRRPLPSGRRVERREHSARGLREVREHDRAGVASRQPTDLRRILLDQRRRRVPGAPRGLFHVRRRRPNDDDHPVARPCGGAPGPLSRGATQATKRSSAPWRCLSKAVPTFPERRSRDGPPAAHRRQTIARSDDRASADTLS